MIHQNAPAHVSFDELSQWLYTIAMMGYTFAGAPNYPAGVINLDPASEHYRQRVFETLCFVFMPAMLERMGTADAPGA
ncbi:MAG: hypothetical protein SWH68_11600 [Thermodesulfobacteriota bacterium]|nr:hypothetical protein [Thermodesulfobacteriota bacterium]